MRCLCALLGVLGAWIHPLIPCFPSLAFYFRYLDGYIKCHTGFSMLHMIVDVTFRWILSEYWAPVFFLGCSSMWLSRARRFSPEVDLSWEAALGNSSCCLQKRCSRGILSVSFFFWGILLKSWLWFEKSVLLLVISLYGSTLYCYFYR